MKQSHALPKDLKSLSPERLELLARRARKSVDSTRVAPAKLTIPKLPRTAESENFPLSFAQERLWFLQQLEPESSVYNMPEAARLVGPLNVRAFEDSLNKIVNRHEILRTTFINID